MSIPADPLSPPGGAPTYIEEWLTGPLQTNFYTRLYLPPNGTAPTALVVFIHGFQDHIARYDHVFRYIQQAAKDVAVFTFDQRGWGQTALNKEHKTRGSSYGSTCRTHQLEDVEFFVKQATEKVHGDFGTPIPVFVWGQSMGGGIGLSFATAKKAPPTPSTLKSLGGVIICSPLVQLSVPPANIVRAIGRLVANVIPGCPLPAEVKAVGLSRNPAIAEAVKADPLIKAHVTVGVVKDMLDAGDYLLAKGYQDWPRDMPLLMVHGTDDKVCSYPASHEFYDKVTADDKQYIPYEGAYHEVFNEPDLWESAVDDIVKWIKSRSMPHAKL